MAFSLLYRKIKLPVFNGRIGRAVFYTTGPEVASTSN